MNTIKLFAAVLFLSVMVFGFTNGQAADDISQVPEDHSHYYPYTQTLEDDYHVRLYVDHEIGKVWLIFEDITEKKVNLIRTKTIAAEAILPDGRSENATFRIAQKAIGTRTTHKDAHPVRRMKERKAGAFSYKADWVKSTPQFDLNVSFPFKGKVYDYVFNYEGVIEKTFTGNGNK